MMPKAQQTQGLIGLTKATKVISQVDRNPSQTREKPDCRLQMETLRLTNSCFLAVISQTLKTSLLGIQSRGA